MSFVPRVKADIVVDIDIDQVGWAASAVQYGYDNNRNYMNLRAARWRDVDQLIKIETDLMAPCLSDAADGESFERLWAQACERFDLPYELEDAPNIVESAYALDFGTAAATLALNAAGCPTIMSCNGHGRSEPYVGFWLPLAKVSLLKEAAVAAGIGLGNAINGAVAAYSDTPDGLLRFAKELRRRSAALGRIRSSGWTRKPDTDESGRQLGLAIDVAKSRRPRPAARSTRLKQLTLDSAAED